MGTENLLPLELLVDPQHDVQGILLFDTTPTRQVRLQLTEVVGLVRNKRHFGTQGGVHCHAEVVDSKTEHVDFRVQPLTQQLIATVTITIALQRLINRHI